MRPLRLPSTTRSWQRRGNRTFILTSMYRIRRLGRYEMLSLHVFLFMRRIKGRTPALKSIGQEVTDEFFRDVDHSLRELGIGDSGVPKRMKKLARMFYGRIESYDKALENNDYVALVAALARNVRPGHESWPGADCLSANTSCWRPGTSKTRQMI